MLEFVFILTVWNAPESQYDTTAYPVAIGSAENCAGMVEHYNATNPNWTQGIPSCEVGTGWRAPDFRDFYVNGENLALGPCRSEDSQNCFWNAQIRGNGEGQSFIDVKGQYFVF